MITDIKICSHMSPKVRRILFPILATVPAALVALATENLGILITITGAYAGAGIQYVIPCSLVFLARRRLDKLRLSVLHLPENPLSSPFRSRAWLVLLMVWSSVAV